MNLQPATPDHLAALRRRLRRDRVAYATNFFLGAWFPSRDLGPAWNLFVT